MIATSFTRLLGCAEPIQLAGMGNCNRELVAAVSRAGALGMIGAVQMPKEVLVQMLASLKGEVPQGRFGVNFLAPFVDAACVDAVASQADLVEFFYDTPDESLVNRVHDGGSLAGWQVGSAEEARQAIDAGCDLIVAQGVEAGGHVRGTTPILALLEEITSFARVPVLAAGGPGGGSGLAAALNAGAAGVRIGTRFITATESAAHPQYIEALLRARAADTVLTTEFGVGWPDAPHRVLRSCLDAAHRHDGDVVGSMQQGGQEVDVPKFFVAWPDQTATGNVAAMCQYAGESVDSFRQRQSAADIVQDIVSGAQALIR